MTIRTAVLLLLLFVGCAPAKPKPDGKEPPSACEGLDYCACTAAAGCEVKAEGCLCPCDFGCPKGCMCVCGGGKYLGCQKKP
jgi:hypothetical protein